MHLGDPGRKAAVRVGVDRELGGLSLADLADIGLVDLGGLDGLIETLRSRNAELKG